jgi:PHP family Zn ribbon phosphoesterase
LKKFFYDFHIHSCLSPCGDDEMSPENIVAISNLIGLDVIAITDHNSAQNAPAIIEAASRQGSPLVVAGMEIESSEGVHFVFLFPSASLALDASKELESRMFGGSFSPEFYGRQLVMDSFDNTICEREDLLVTPTDLGIYDMKAFAEKYSAAFYPAHIDRSSNGILSVMGEIDTDMGFSTVELSKYAAKEIEDKYIKKGYNIIKSSDAHFLHDISERENYLQLKNLSTTEIIEKLK